MQMQQIRAGSWRRPCNAAASSSRVHHIRPVVTMHSSSSSNGTQSKPLISEEAKQQAKEAAAKFLNEAQEFTARTWTKLDSEHQISDKVSKATRRLEEQARDVDQTYNVRRRIRSSIEHVQRMWPVWSSKLDAFSSTTLGKGTILVAILLIISSPIFWSVLNFFLILWWLAIPIGAALINSAQRQAAQRMASEAAERQARNPFADMFAGRTTATNPQQPSGRSRGYEPPAGPVIDADFVVIKDDPKK